MKKLLFLIVLLVPQFVHASSFATEVVNYAKGNYGDGEFVDPDTALGLPDGNGVVVRGGGSLIVGLSAPIPVGEGLGVYTLKLIDDPIPQLAGLIEVSENGSDFFWLGRFARIDFIEGLNIIRTDDIPIPLGFSINNINYVSFETLSEAPADFNTYIGIDAVSSVPEPTALFWLLGVGVLLRRR
jgi:hypothetical protein